MSNSHLTNQQLESFRNYYAETGDALQLARKMKADGIPFGETLKAIRSIAGVGLSGARQVMRDSGAWEQEVSASDLMTDQLMEVWATYEKDVQEEIKRDRQS
ncbi:MAG: hypothetical protein R3C11_04645 [Planctomycetaceae bacterium]